MPITIEAQDSEAADACFNASRADLPNTITVPGEIDTSVDCAAAFAAAEPWKLDDDDKDEEKKATQAAAATAQLRLKKAIAAVAIAQADDEHNNDGVLFNLVRGEPAVRKQQRLTGLAKQTGMDHARTTQRER